MICRGRLYRLSYSREASFSRRSGSSKCKASFSQPTYVGSVICISTAISGPPSLMQEATSSPGTSLPMLLLSAWHELNQSKSELRTPTMGGTVCMIGLIGGVVERCAYRGAYHAIVLKQLRHQPLRCCPDSVILSVWKRTARQRVSCLPYIASSPMPQRLNSYAAICGQREDNVPSDVHNAGYRCATCARLLVSGTGT